MAAHFHPVVVKSIYKETPDCVIITFDIPEQLVESFKYIQGQNITLRKNINGEELRRSYSICSAPFENRLSIAVKKVPEGKFSIYANSDLQAGDVIDVLPPSGSFNTMLAFDNTKRYLAIAAGSGITPVISIIKATLAMEPASFFTLVNGNRSRNSIIFFEELAALKNKYPARFNLINLLSGEKTVTPLNYGRIGPAKLKDLQKIISYTLMDEIFICGPAAMLFSVREFLDTQRIDKRKVHFELFTTHSSKPVETQRARPVEKKNTNSNIVIQLDGRSFSFDLAFDNTSILDAALKEGADLPFACKGGVCATCKAKLIIGEVSMDVNYALEEDELEKGFILTCQSRPLTEKIVIDFDSR